MSIKGKISSHTLKKLEAISGKKLTLGNLLWSIRKGDDKTQAEFAMILGVSKQYLSNVEHNRRFVRPKTAAEWAKRLGYSTHQFVRLCLQDMVDRDHLKVQVDVKAA